MISTRLVSLVPLQADSPSDINLLPSAEQPAVHWRAPLRPHLTVLHLPMRGKHHPLLTQFSHSCWVPAYQEHRLMVPQMQRRQHHHLLSPKPLQLAGVTTVCRQHLARKPVLQHRQHRQASAFPPS